ncbi:hypothetical protein THF1C08_30052 [Vibrio jasicida]|uniref:Uncharacterized protein n=1 Tax=Vibrio jasicida TaxID=766224 RepID=A0AAU9QRU5_9VIBR|nr:hypothetical protein THF1C08_30052 [Vibrio jasicida]CAH1600008.1 hypothetical protein THF1A12_40382 [Vibrio jasicida]
MSDGNKVLIQWTVKATGEVKQTRHPMLRVTAQKLVNWLNKSNRRQNVGSVYEIIN